MIICACIRRYAGKKWVESSFDFIKDFKFSVKSLCDIEHKNQTRMIFTVQSRNDSTRFFPVIQYIVC